jgi:WD40 repeat protein
MSGHTNYVRSVAFSPDGRRGLSGSDDGTLRLWDLETGEEVCRFTGHRDLVYGVAFAPDGRRILSGGGILPGKPGGAPDA